MRKLILQHWSGPLTELTELSSANISAYATSVGAEYMLLREDFFHKYLSPQCQKVGMIMSQFDDYDVVVMIDADMFTTIGTMPDIFEETGVGIEHVKVQNRLHRMKCPYSNLETPLYGGAIYRMDRDRRQLLRQYLDDRNEVAMKWFSKSVGHSVDEGIIHQLNIRAAVVRTPGCFLEQKWAYGNCMENPKMNGVLIHIRPKISFERGRETQAKMLNYKMMVEQGVINP